MQLYVANTTRQVHDFTYRVPELNGLKRQPIPMGGQIRVFGDLNPPQLDSIVKQHAKYGMVPADELDRVLSFAGLCYSVDKPVAPSKIDRALRYNNDALVKRGKEIRKESAVAVNNSIEQSIENSDLSQAISGVNKFEMVVIEERRNGSDETSPQLSEGVRVTREQGPRQPKARGRRKAA